jgi:hypothetical protein
MYGAAALSAVHWPRTLHARDGRVIRGGYWRVGASQCIKEINRGNVVWLSIVLGNDAAFLLQYVILCTDLPT